MDTKIMKSGVPELPSVSMSTPRSTIDVLLSLVPDSPERVLQQLATEPSQASAQDSHGYSLLHAAASYGHVDMIKELVHNHSVSVNIVDQDQETPLFYAEEVEVARTLVNLGTDVKIRNLDGQTAEEKIEGEEDFPLVAAFLRQLGNSNSVTSEVTANGSSTPLAHPPPLPNGIQVNIETVHQTDAEAPDPAFRRRIEELAARDDFHNAEGQQQLRALIMDAVSGLREDAGHDEGGPARRRRLDR